MYWNKSYKDENFPIKYTLALTWYLRCGKNNIISLDAMFPKYHVKISEKEKKISNLQNFL